MLIPFDRENVLPQTRRRGRNLINILGFLGPVCEIPFAGGVDVVDGLERSTVSISPYHSLIQVRLRQAERFVFANHGRCSLADIVCEPGFYSEGELARRFCQSFGRPTREWLQGQQDPPIRRCAHSREK